jgi:Lrp/AsnC family leucine-responsive transcriptional regulator
MNIDVVDNKILAELQRDDRQSLAEIGRCVGLAPSSLAERIKKLTQSGVITGFHAHVSAEALGLDLLAFIFVGWTDPATEAPFLARVAEEPAILECHHVTGAWNYLMKVRVRATRDLEGFLSDVVKSVPGLLRTESLIVLSSAKETTVLPIEPRPWTRSRQQ